MNRRYPDDLDAQRSARRWRWWKMPWGGSSVTR